MAIKNYTTSVPASRTISEIEKMLVKNGAREVYKQYSQGGQLAGIAFKIETRKGVLPIKMPARIEKIAHIIRHTKELSKNRRTDPDHHERVAWRIIKDWLDAQLALLETEMVDMHEIFLPYAYNENTGQTLFEAYEERGLSGLLPDAQGGTQ